VIQTPSANYDAYRSNVERHLVPALGKIPLQQLTWETLEEYVEERSENLSGQTLSHHLRLLSRALKDAVKKGYVTRNVVELVDNAPKIKRKKIEAFDAKNNQRLVDLFNGEMKTIVALALTTGMRRGEIAGLKWDAVGDEVLEVKRALTQTREGLILREQPKTDDSFRKITLTKEMLKALRHHKADQAREKLAAGNTYRDEGYVFACFDGRPIKPARITRAFLQVVKETDFNLSFHGLRHCHVSQLIAANVNIKTIQKRVGHSNIKTTLDTYGHLLPGMDKAAAEAIEGTVSL
jgi:integrase